MKNLLVIVVSFNSMPWVERCYGSLRSSSIPCDVVVIDNGSTDGTIEFIQDNFPEVRVIENENNLGFGKANNIGLQIAIDEGYEYTYLLNQDAWVLPDTFEKLIKISNDYPEYGVLSPMQMKADLQHMDNKFVSYVIGVHQCKHPFLVEDLLFNRCRSVYEVSFVMAAHWLITRTCLLTVGGFSPSFPHYGEDDNYLQRVNYWKLKAGIVPMALAVHDRADNNWCQEKELYIQQYIGALKYASNPLGKGSLWPYIKANVKLAIKKRTHLLWHYAVLLFQQRTKIDMNYNLSLRKGAFLRL